MIMKRTRQTVSKTLNSVDIFEEPIHFNMSGDINLTSSLGGAVSVAIIVFLAVQAIMQSVEMFNRDDPRLLQMNEYEDEPTRMLLNSSNNFVLAVSMNRDNTPMDLRTNAVVSFTSTFNAYVRSADGTQTRNKFDIYWAPCNQSNSPSPTFPENTFSTYSLAYAYCPTMIDFKNSVTGTCSDSIRHVYPDCKAPPSFALQGTFLSTTFEFVNFKLKTCSPTDSKYIDGLTCTTENINTVFTNSELQLNLYFANTLIDPVNFNVPNRTFLDTIYWNLHPSVSTAADIFVDSETVQDFHYYFSNDDNDNSTFYSIQRGNTREVRKYRSTSLLEWNLRRSNLNHVTSRTYTKVLDVVSNIGGMSELFMLLGAMVVLGYTRFKYMMILGNELYDFQPIEKQQKKPHMDTSRSALGLTIQNTRLGDISMDASETNNRSRSFFKIGTAGSKKKIHAESAETVKDYFEVLKKRKRVLSYNEVSYVKYLIKFLFCIKSNPDEIMAKKAMKQVRDDLDIIKVIEKLKEIDKLKMLLLNSDQRKAFDFIEKPLFVMDREKPLQAGSLGRVDESGKEAIAQVEMKSPTYSHDYDSLSDYAKLYMAYRTLKDDPEIENIKYNQKLMDMISEDLRAVFVKVDPMMGPKPDPKKFEEIVQRIMQTPDISTGIDEKTAIIPQNRRELSPDDSPDASPCPV